MILVYLLALLGGACLLSFLCCLVSYLWLNWQAERDWKKSQKHSEDLINEIIKRWKDTGIY